VRNPNVDLVTAAGQLGICAIPLRGTFAQGLRETSIQIHREVGVGAVDGFDRLNPAGFLESISLPIISILQRSLRAEDGFQPVALQGCFASRIIGIGVREPATARQQESIRGQLRMTVSWHEIFREAITAKRGRSSQAVVYMQKPFSFGLSTWKSMGLAL